jgi:hypothetical protein
LTGEKATVQARASATYIPASSGFSRLVASSSVFSCSVSLNFDLFGLNHIGYYRDGAPES